MAETPPYAHTVSKVSLIGTCFNGAEEWTTGFYLGYETADSGDPANAAGFIAPLWQTFFTTAGTGISSAYKTTQVKVANIGADGKTDPDAVDYYTYPTPIQGGAGSTTMPPQISLAATLTSSLPRGLASKGRMFLPGINFTVSATTGKLSTVIVAPTATNLKTFLDGVNALTLFAGKVILASHGHKTEVLPGGDIVYMNPVNKFVTGLRVGDVYDTQRRRRNDLVETYESRTLAP